MVRHLVLALALLLGGVARGQTDDSPAPPPETEARPTVRITLTSGDILTGELIDRDDQGIVIDHPIAEIVVIPMEDVLQVVRVSGPLEGTGPPPEEDGEDLEEPVVDESPTAQPPTMPRPSLPKEKGAAKEKKSPKEKPKATWSGTVEAGLNGSTGNTDLRNMRAAFSIRRKSTEMIFDASSSYRFTERDGEERQNRFFGEARNEWRLPNTKWRYVFVQGSLEIDKFRDYDYRVAGTAGFGYQFIDRDKTSLVGRVGLGAAREFGGPNDDIQPEAFGAVELKHAINDRLRLRAAAEIFPDLADVSEFRSRVNGSLEIDLDNHSKWRLRLGFEDRYETNTSRAEKNDLDYFATLVYTF